MRAAVWVSALTACAPQVFPETPPIDGRSALLVVRSFDQLEVRAVAVAPFEPLPPFRAPDGSDVVLLAWPGDLAERQVEPGPIALVPSGRLLPAPELLLGLAVPERRWRPLDAVPPWLNALGLPLLDACPDEGCHRVLGGALQCDTPCPELGPIDAPAAPALPRFELRPCPENWSEPGAGRCAPPPALACPVGWFQPPSEAACQPLSECPGGRFPDAPAGARYVDPAAGGGDGSRDRPFAGLDDALTGPGVVVLAPGDHRVGAALPDGLSLLGACAAEVVVEGPALVPAGVQVSAEGLRFADVAVVDGRLELSSVVLAGARVGGALVGQRVRIQGEIAVRAGGELNLHRVDAREAGLDAAGNARASDLRWEGSLRLRGDAEAVFEQLSVVHGTDALSLEGASRATLDDVHVSARRAVVLRDAAALDANGFDFEGVSLLDATGTSRATFESGFIRAAGTTEVMDEASVVARQLRLEAGPEARLLVGGRASARLLDIELGETAVELFGDSELRLRRVVSRGPIELGRSSGYPPSYSGAPSRCNGRPVPASRVQLDAEDLSIERSTGHSIVACGGSVVRLARAQLRGGELGLVADCKQRCTNPDEVAVLDVSDLRVEGASETGLIQRGGTLSLERADLGGMSEFGVYIWGAATRASHLRVGPVFRDPPPEDLDRYCSSAATGELRGPGSAVFVEQWFNSGTDLNVLGIAVLRRFLLEGGQCSGISAGFAAQLDLEDGLIRENLRGLNLLRDSLEDVSGSRMKIAEDVLFDQNVVHVREVSTGR